MPNMPMHGFQVSCVKAKSRDLTVDAGVDLTAIESEKEIDLLKKLGEFPQAVSEAALKRVPHRITNYIFELASAFHSFYNANKVLDSENPERTKARLALVRAVQITMKNALSLIGVSAPEKM